LRVFRDDGAPIGAVETGPVSGLLLIVALVTLVASWPVTTHAIRFDIPLNAPRPKISIAAGATANSAGTGFNTVSVNVQDMAMWNGVPVDLVTLSEYLEISRTLDPEPVLRIEPDPRARYGQVMAVLAVVKRSGVANVSFVGNRTYADFGK
jgi:biopolymer transport protein ExbD